MFLTELRTMSRNAVHLSIDKRTLNNFLSISATRTIVKFLNTVNMATVRYCRLLLAVYIIPTNKTEIGSHSLAVLHSNLAPS